MTGKQAHTSQTHTGSERPFTGRHMLAIMLAFFGVIVAVNVTMAWLANQTWTGLVVKNSYVASQNFNAELSRARSQAARGWTSSLKYREGRIVFQLADREGNPVILDGFRVTIGRPAYEQEDAVLALMHKGNGRYEAARTLAPGTWALRVEGGVGHRAYRRDSRMIIPEKTSGDG